MPKIKETGTYADKANRTQFFYAKGTEVADLDALELVGTPDAAPEEDAPEEDAKATDAPANKKANAPENKGA